MIKKIAFIIIAVNIFIFADPLSGTGTESDPYKITTVHELDSVRNHLSSHFVLMNDLDFTGIEYSSHDMSFGWYPIGRDGMSFTGNFNGKGHVIKNIYMYRPMSSNIGLFGATSDAVIDSLGMTDFDITGKSSVGSIAGSIIGTQISNCFASGKVTGRTWYIGGLIGWSNTSTVVNCSTNGSVSGTDNIGGLIGNANVYVIIKNCYSLASAYSEEDIVGGLVGRCSWTSSISNSYAAGIVEGDGIKIGGLVGDTSRYSTISGSYYDSDVSGLLDDSKGVAITTTDMMKKNTFNGWDFDSTWQINENSSYPFFLWQNRTTSILQIAQTTDKGLCVAPNPVYNNGAVVGLHSGEQYGIYNIDNKLLYKVTLSQNFDFSKLVKGVYFIITSENRKILFYKE